MKSSFNKNINLTTFQVIKEKKFQEQPIGEALSELIQQSLLELSRKNSANRINLRKSLEYLISIANSDDRNKILKVLMEVNENPTFFTINTLNLISLNNTEEKLQYINQLKNDLDSENTNKIWNRVREIREVVSKLSHDEMEDLTGKLKSVYEEYKGISNKTKRHFLNTFSELLKHNPESKERSYIIKKLAKPDFTTPSIEKFDQQTFVWLNKALNKLPDEEKKSSVETFIQPIYQEVLGSEKCNIDKIEMLSSVLHHLNQKDIIDFYQVLKQQIQETKEESVRNTLYVQLGDVALAIKDAKIKNQIFTLLESQMIPEATGKYAVCQALKKSITMTSPDSRLSFITKLSSLILEKKSEPKLNSAEYLSISDYCSTLASLYHLSGTTFEERDKIIETLMIAADRHKKYHSVASKAFTIILSKPTSVNVKNNILKTLLPSLSKNHSCVSIESAKILTKIIDQINEREKHEEILSLIRKQIGKIETRTHHHIIGLLTHLHQKIQTYKLIDEATSTSMPTDLVSLMVSYSV